MKKSTITLLCLLIINSINLSLMAQETKEFNTKKTEVNIGVANIFAKNNIYDSYYYMDNDFYLPYVYTDIFRKPELVIGIKFHDDKGAFRIGTNFNYSNITTKENSSGDNNVKYKSFRSKLNVGYEWHSTFSRLVIYYGFDISTSYNYHYNEYKSNSYNGPTTSESKLNEYTLGVNPFIGTNFFITPNLSIGTEVKFIAEYVSGKTINSSLGSSNTNESKSSGIRTSFGPLGFLSINLNF